MPALSRSTAPSALAAAQLLKRKSDEDGISLPVVKIIPESRIGAFIPVKRMTGTRRPREAHTKRARTDSLTDVSNYNPGKTLVLKKEDTVEQRMESVSAHELFIKKLLAKPFKIPIPNYESSGRALGIRWVLVGDATIDWLVDVFSPFYTKAFNYVRALDWLIG